jgi:hypothetical protein
MPWYKNKISPAPCPTLDFLVLYPNNIQIFKYTSHDQSPWQHRILMRFPCLALFAGVWFYFSLLSAVFSFVFVYVLLADDHVNNVSYFPVSHRSLTTTKKMLLIRTQRRFPSHSKYCVILQALGLRFWVYLGRYLYWWTISPRGYHPPISQYFGPDMVY